MDASIVDLRYKTKEILSVLERNEEVRVLYRGKLKGRIIPANSPSSGQSIVQHPFFGCDEDTRSVEEIMDELRKPRY